MIVSHCSTFNAYHQKEESCRKCMFRLECKLDFGLPRGAIASPSGVQGQAPGGPSARPVPTSVQGNKQPDMP